MKGIPDVEEVFWTGVLTRSGPQIRVFGQNFERDFCGFARAWPRARGFLT